jgi:Fe-S-cluster containining protein
MYMLTKGTGKTFTDMIEREIEIRLVDGLILPNLMQHHESDETGERSGREDALDLLSGDHCPFLSQAGRCSIHPFRPGMCRLYPMGRYYTEGGFRYILQKDECTDREKTSVLLQDWLGIENLARYESYILDWHDFKGQAEESLHILTQKSRESVTRYILQIFFVHPYEVKLDFYAQYDARMEICRQALADILPK